VVYDRRTVATHGPYRELLPPCRVVSLVVRLEDDLLPRRVRLAAHPYLRRSPQWADRAQVSDGSFGDVCMPWRGGKLLWPSRSLRTYPRPRVVARAARGHSVRPGCGPSASQGPRLFLAWLGLTARRDVSYTGAAGKKVQAGLVSRRAFDPAKAPILCLVFIHGLPSGLGLRLEVNRI